jgi:hydrophobic/amphiphilic exporter-1 (mainly G- bacteria), HAE1 family
MLVGIGLVYLLTVILFGSVLVPVVILFALPLAVIVVTNAIVLLDLVQHRIEAGDDVRTAPIQGGRTRVRPGVVLGQVRTNG